MEERVVEKGLEGRFDYLEHTADLYIRAYGRDLLELFSNAGLSIFESMTSTRMLEPRERRDVEAEGFDLENLLYRWLEELLTLYYSEGFMCREVYADEIIIRRVNGEREYRVKGYCIGEVFDPEKHESKVEIKAVTYHQMKIIRSEDGGWRAYYVLDI